jgi:hypothetical protein
MRTLQDKMEAMNVAAAKDKTVSRGELYLIATTSRIAVELNALSQNINTLGLIAVMWMESVNPGAFNKYQQLIAKLKQEEDNAPDSH